MLTRLKVNKFRHVKPGTELTFREGFNVLLGRNGTGKTTLLDLISRVVRSDFSSLRDEEFDLDYELAHTLGRVHVRVQNTQLPEHTNDHTEAARRVKPPVASRFYDATLTAEVSFCLNDDAARLVMDASRSSLRLTYNDAAWSEQFPIDLFSGNTFSELANGLRFAPTIPASEPEQMLRDFSSLSWWSHRFDESLGTYQAVTRSSSEPESEAPIRALSLRRLFDAKHQDPVVEEILNPARVPWYQDITEPLLGQSSTIVRLSTRPLKEFPELVGFTAMTMSLSVEGSSREEGAIFWDFGRAEFQFSEPGGSTFSHHALSYGQKRLLAFLYYRSINRRYVIADELVNGMHHDWIRTCVDLCSEPGTQSFLTSQNPLLLDYIPLASAEDARQTFIQCRTEVTNGRARFAWSNLSEEDARELFADHQVGIQHLGELLRVRGLW